MSSYRELRDQGPAVFAEQTGRRRYWEVLSAARVAMLDPATGLARAELTEPAVCAACGEDRPYGGFTKDGFHYVRCTSCGTVYITPQLTEEALMNFWTNSPVSEAWTEVLRHPAQREFDEAKFSRALDSLIERHEAGTLLDFGCSIGVFLELARRRGFEVYGVEPGRAARQLGKDLFGLEIAASLQEIPNEQRFSVITAWEVLEHTKRPLQQLELLSGRASSDARLVILVGGNAASFANRIMRGASAAFDFARLWYFTPESFTQLLSRAGWMVTDVEDVLDEIDVVEAYLGYGDPYQPRGFDEEIFSESVRSSLRNHALAGGMGYKFRVTATPA